jgi:hypothetical protein
MTTAMRVMTANRVGVGLLPLTAAGRERLARRVVEAEVRLRARRLAFRGSRRSAVVVRFRVLVVRPAVAARVRARVAVRFPDSVRAGALGCLPVDAVRFRALAGEAGFRWQAVVVASPARAERSLAPVPVVQVLPERAAQPRASVVQRLLASVVPQLRA